MEVTRAKLPLVLLLVLLAVSSSGCEVIEGIFKAGLLVGIILVVIAIALVMWIVRKLRR